MVRGARRIRRYPGVGVPALGVPGSLTLVIDWGFPARGALGDCELLAVVRCTASALVDGHQRRLKGPIEQSEPDALSCGIEGLVIDGL